jgi:hypothetical protein
MQTKNYRRKTNFVQVAYKNIQQRKTQLRQFNMTPHQLELALIAECLNADELKNSTDDVVEKELNYDEIQEMVRSIPVYVDES